MRDFLLKLSQPIQDVMSKMHPPYAQTTVRQSEHVMEIMQDGDILLSRESWHFTNYFIPGFWSHAAIYGNRNVVEAVKPRVQIVDFRDWVIEKHNWVVLRPPKLDTKITRASCYELALQQLYKPYDDLFSDKNDAWYCSEIVREVYKQSGLLPKSILEKEIVYPEHFYKEALLGNLLVVYEHRDK